MKTIKVSDGDWDVNAAGRTSYVTGREKLAQDIANALLQSYNESLGYGSFLSTIEQRSPTLGTEEHHKLRIHQEVSDAIDRWIELQERDEDLTDEETIAGFNVLVERGEQDLYYYYFLSVQSEAGDESVVKAYEIKLGHKKDPDLDLESLTRIATT